MLQRHFDNVALIFADAFLQRAVIPFPRAGRQRAVLCTASLLQNIAGQAGIIQRVGRGYVDGIFQNVEQFSDIPRPFVLHKD